METIETTIKNMLSGLHQNKQIGVIAFDHNEKIILSNEVIEQLFQKKESTILNRNLIEEFSFIKSIHPEEILSGKSGRIPSQELGFKEDDFAFDLEYYPIYNKSGEAFGVLLFNNLHNEEKKKGQIIYLKNFFKEDASHRKNLMSQRSLLEEIGKELLAVDSKSEEYSFLEDLVKKIAVYSDTYIYLIDWKEKKFIYSSRPILEALGYGRNEIISPHLFISYLIHPDDWELVQHKLAELPTSDKHSIEMEYRVKSKSEEWKWFLTRIQIYKEENGEILEVLGTSVDITKGKELELEIKKNELIFNETQKIAKMGHWEWVVGKEWMTWTEGLFRIYGYEKYPGPVITYEDFLEQVFPEDRHIVIDAVNDIFVTMKPFDIRHRIKRKSDGKTTYIYCKGRVLEAQNGKPIRLLGISLDVTELELAREELRKINIELEDRIKERTRQLEIQKENLHNMLMHIPAAVAVFECPDYVFKFTNDLHNDYTGKSNIQGKKLLKVFPDAEKQGITRLFDRVYISGESIYKEEFATSLFPNGLFQKKDFCSIALIPLKNGHKNVTGILVHAIDVTNSVRDKQKVIESEKKLKQLLEAIPQMAWTALPNGDVNYYNKRWYEFTGQTLEESFILSWKEIVHPDDLAETVSLWTTSVKEGTPFEKENRFLGADQSYRWFLVRAVPLRDTNNQIILWVGSCTDIQDQKLFQEELITSNQELKKINMDMDNFLYTASHDLKIPISNIEGLIETLSGILEHQKIQNTDLDQIILFMRKSVDRFRHTIRDLTDISKVQKNLNRDIGDIDVAQIIEEVKTDLHQMIEVSKPIFNINIQSCSTVRFSRRNFRSVVYNLISNALKFRSGDRKLQIDITAYKEDKWCVLTFKDNGLGIKSEDYEKIFEMFRRLHDHVEGTGIGLYIVKRILDNAGGKIEVESEEGKGATFKIYIKNINF